MTLLALLGLVVIAGPIVTLSVFALIVLHVEERLQGRGK